MVHGPQQRPSVGGSHAAPPAGCTLWNEAACYHVMNRGQNRRTLFADEGDLASFVGLLARYGRRFDVRLYPYCLLNNHFHLLLPLPQPRRLSSLMAGLLVAYVRSFQRRYHFVGHVFQGRFKSPAVQAESYLLRCGRYSEHPQSAGGRGDERPVDLSLVQLPGLCTGGKRCPAGCQPMV